MPRPALLMHYVPLLLPALCGAAEPAPLRVVAALAINAVDFDAGQRAFALIMQRAGLTYTLTQEPQERAVTSLKAGLYDADAARVAGFDKDVPGMVRIDPPLLVVTVRAYGHSPLPASTPWAGLARYRMAHVRGQRAVEYQLPKGVASQGVATASACLGMAAAGRVDYCVLASLTPPTQDPAFGHLQAQVLNQTPLYIWVGPGREALARRIGDALRGASASGDIDRALLGERAR